MPGFVELPIKTFSRHKLAWRLFVPFGQLQGNFSVLFYHCQNVREAFQQVQGIANTGEGQVGEAPDDLEMQHFKVPK